MDNTNVESTFAGTGLPVGILEGLTRRGITVPTPIQAAVIPLALEGGDLLAQARTGSGKTLAFLLPLAARILADELHRVWIICPTRELAQQGAREAVTLLGGDRAAVLVGGVPVHTQVHDLRRNPPLVFGTPGRMADLLAQGILKPDAEIVVLDEADQMMDMGFAEELERLMRDLGSSVARWLFSATFPRQVQDAVNRWLDEPREVRLDAGIASSHVRQRFTVARRGDEMTALARLLHTLEPARALVFVRTREDVERTVRAIVVEGIEAAGISGILTQEARERVLGRFRAGQLSVLVGTDVAARGLDVPGISHVFNLNLPANSDAYVHRIGRTARAGADGEAWSVIGTHERGRLLRIAASSHCRVEEAPLPTARTIVDAKRERLAKRVQDSLGEKLSLPVSFRPLIEEFGAETVLAGLIHRLIPDAPVEKPVEAPPRSVRSPGGPARTRSGTGEGVPIYLGIGSADGLQPGNVVAMLCNQCGLTGGQVGRIRLLERHCLLNVHPDVVERIMRHAPHHRGRSVVVRLDRIGGPGVPPRRGSRRH